ncbi:MAG: hypothetical protein F4Y38_00075 [Gemmatimonadetes bacterium]|nr:hypothetical protein [Gemmatimonadota bacterium]MYG83704.1 hypothetical protein [Gemmatimonadota bacterium]MYJ91077.1 hypothetical protein [Gemmatimonadota bacterium]
MNDKLKKYLEKCSPAKVDMTLIDELRSALKKAVPKIAEKVKQREKLAAQLRVTASTPRQSKSDK